MRSQHDFLIDSLRAHGIKDERVIDAIAKVPRESFVPPGYKEFAYGDHALPIECKQTLSQPYIVARMTEAVIGDRSVKSILEIGTGSGYQSAVLAELVPHVYSIERILTLHNHARITLNILNYKNITLRRADGTKGWPEKAPFDGIIVTAACKTVPPQLKEQLADGGHLVIPVGGEYGQELQLIIRKKNEFVVSVLDPVIFVPLLPGTAE